MEDIEEKLKELQIEAIGYLKKKNFDRAIAVYQEMQANYKDSDYACQIACSNLGVIYLNLQKLDLAEDYLKKALSYSPLQPEYHHLLGIVYLQSKRPLEAVKELKVCLKQKPDNSKYLEALSVALFDAGKKSEALETLGRVASLDMDASRILAVQAADCLRDGNLKKALKLAEEARALNLDNVMASNVIKAIHKKQLANLTAKPPAVSSLFDIYQFKMKLKGIIPPIWRRFQVSGNISLYKLHLVMQALMEWQNYHLFEFQIGEIRFGIPDPEDYYETKDARRYKLYKLLSGEKTKLSYIYDFGDGWQHELTVEKIIPAEQELKHPLCLDGRRAGPPEDCGGIGGYENYLEILRTPPLDDPDEEDEEIKSSREWIGADFDPEHFDLEEINRKLRKIR